MKVSKIRHKNKFYEIVFEDLETLMVYETVIHEFNIYINKDIKENELLKIKKFNKLEDFYYSSVSKINKGIYSKDKLVSFLENNNASIEDIKITLNRLEQNNYFNEGLIIKEMVEHYQRKFYGFVKIKAILESKGFDAYKIMKYKTSSEDEAKNVKLLCKKIMIHNSMCSYNELKRKMYQKCLANGFDNDVINEIINKIIKYDNNHELNMLKLEYDKILSRYIQLYSGLELDQKVTKYLLNKGYKINDINYIKERNK